MKTMKTRQLRLSRETLRSLQPAHLDQVAGGTLLPPTNHGCPAQTAICASQTMPCYTNRCGTYNCVRSLECSASICPTC